MKLGNLRVLVVGRSGYSQLFESWIAEPENFCVVAESEGVVKGIGLLHGSGEVRLLYTLRSSQVRDYIAAA